MNQRKLTLHIGAGKTGTSAFQSFAAKNSSRLLSDFGLLYPTFGAFDDAAQGKITSGNGLSISQYIRGGMPKDHVGAKELGDVLERLESDSSVHILLSSEHFWGMRPSHVMMLAKMCREKSAKLQLVGVARDIYPMLVSIYGQRVKRHGLFSDFKTFTEEVSVYLDPLCGLIKASEQSGSFSISVLNYDDIKSSVSRSILEACLERSLHEDWVSDENRIVNRSLDSWETRLMRSVNGVFGQKYSNAVSDSLIYTDPERETSSFLQETIPTSGLERKFGQQTDLVNRYICGKPLKLSVPRGEQSDGALETQISNSIERQTVVLLSVIRRSFELERADDERVLNSKQAELTMCRSIIREKDVELEKINGENASIRKEIEGLRAEVERAQSNMRARRSKVANYIEKLDYKIHLAASRFPLLTRRRRERYAAAAAKRWRPSYDA